MRINFSQIQKVLCDAMDTPMTKVIRAGSVNAIGTVNPVAGVLGGIGNDLLEEYNTYKIGCLLEGLAKGLNVETGLNELYTYITSSKEKAIIVANLFKQTINAENPKVAIIYGLILANHMGNNSEFTYDELIVCKALENATDYDLNNFKQIMENYLKEVNNGNRIVFPKEMDNIDEFTITCDWCVYNRVFVSRMPECGEMSDGVLEMDICYYTSKPAIVLLKYLKEARQVWNYGN